MSAEPRVPDQTPERPSAPACLLSLVIPTRNESANARPLIEKLSQVLAGLGAEVIVVDDSDDETPELLPPLAKEHGLSLCVLHREPGDRSGGLSTAVLAGVKAAQGEYLGIMDADLQHPPELIVRMLSLAANSNADVVIASRYVPGGSDAGLSSATRRMISLASKWLVKVLFLRRLWPVSDPLSGFFVVRRALLSETRLRPVGFKILLDILVRSRWSRAEEVPLAFQRRVGGTSKATLKQGRDFLAHVALLYWEMRLTPRVRSARQRVRRAG